MLWALEFFYREKRTAPKCIAVITISDSNELGEEVGTVLHDLSTEEWGFSGFAHDVANTQLSQSVTLLRCSHSVDAALFLSL